VNDEEKGLTIRGSDLQQLYAQCETTQVREEEKGAALFGYTKLYGEVPERYLFLSDVLPTAWQAVEYAAIPRGGSVAVFGLGPIGQMSARIALHKGAERVFGIDRVPERLEMESRHGVETIDFEQHDDVSGVYGGMVDPMTTHRVRLAEAPGTYEMFQKKEDGAIKVILKPGAE
jgi:threonine dehydrogenase-like Zn-dependent dehydrogenase